MGSDRHLMLTISFLFRLSIFFSKYASDPEPPMANGRYLETKGTYTRAAHFAVASTHSASAVLLHSEVIIRPVPSVAPVLLAVQSE